ncbi:MAG: phosphate signaling complex protein PhoU [Candidatus Promineifilaceae bacterium]
MSHLASRSILDKELNQIRENILRMASMVDEAIEKAFIALQTRDVALAQTVSHGDEQINLLRFSLEEECLKVLATQQPMAIDLRTIIAAIHLAVELERIGDHAAGIARLVERMEEEDDIASLHKLPKMTKRARDMVQQGIEAFINYDADLALKMVKRDDKLDRQYNKLFMETMQEMTDEAYVRRATFLLWVGHSLERIGDRATNIAERVIFMVTGQLTELNTEFDIN